MTFEELKQITKQREKRTIEYKEAWSELPGNLFETVCAFLNRDGGVVRNIWEQGSAIYTNTSLFIPANNPRSKMRICISCGRLCR